MQFIDTEGEGTIYKKAHAWSLVIVSVCQCISLALIIHSH